MSRLTLRTLTIGAPDKASEEKTSHTNNRKYMDAGGNCLDVADI